MKGSKIIIILICLILCGCKNKTYTVTFNTDGGTKMKSIVIKKGETLDRITPPEKNGYLFVNWKKNGHEFDINSQITEDITLTATWIEKPNIYETYTVTYKIDEKIEMEKVKENDLITKPKNPQKEDYIFSGWYVGDEEYNFNTPVTKDFVLEAKFIKSTVTITFELSNDSNFTQKIKKGTTIEIPDIPKKDGYRFVKWTLNDKDFSFTSEITEDITLVAIWEEIKYVDIIFDTDGGNQIESITIEKYSKIDTLPTPQKDGYEFKEWTINGNTFNTDTVIKEDILLKAIYK